MPVFSFGSLDRVLYWVEVKGCALSHLQLLIRLHFFLFKYWAGTFFEWVSSWLPWNLAMQRSVGSLEATAVLVEEILDSLAIQFWSKACLPERGITPCVEMSIILLDVEAMPESSLQIMDTIRIKEQQRRLQVPLRTEALPPNEHMVCVLTMLPQVRLWMILILRFYNGVGATVASSDELDFERRLLQWAWPLGLEPSLSPQLFILENLRICLLFA